MAELDEEQQYEWSAYYDDEGNLYYYNATTEESTWEAPEIGFNPPPSPEAGEAEIQDANVEVEPDEIDAEDHEDPRQILEHDGMDAEDHEGSRLIEDDESNASGPTSPSGYPDSPTMNADSHSNPASPQNDPDPADVDGTAELPSDPIGEDDAIQWIAYKDDDGNEYYYNNDTGETQWDKPDRFIAAEQDDSEPTNEEPTVDVEEPEVDNEAPEEIHIEEIKVEDEEPEPVEPEVDLELLKLQQAEEALYKPDSILEPSCIANLSVVVPAHGGNPEKAIKALIDSYHGQTEVCGLLAQWYIEFKQQTSGTTSFTKIENTKSEVAGKKPQKDEKNVAISALSQYSETDANFIRDLATDVINRFANEKFSREAGDSILDLSKSDAAFLEEMMDSPRWRKLLIDLSASHKDSAVLLLCLRDISKRGHHREIAKRINQSEHFAVFNAMLLSELAEIGNVAVSAGSDVSSSSGFEELVNDLLRACSATSYTYLYAVEMLRCLKSKALKDAHKDDNQPLQTCRFKRAIRKWHALSQILEGSMVDPTTAQAMTGSSPLFRKRRLDIALTLSDLHQKQRRRIMIETPNGKRWRSIQQSDQAELESNLLTLLRRYSTGTQIGDTVLDKLLPSTLDLNTRGIGKLLLDHPLAIRALLGHLYRPGTTRVNSPSTKSKCARLVALSVLAAEEFARNEIKKHRSGEDDAILSEETVDEVALTRMIVQGSQLCEQIETMISFTVTSDTHQHLGNISPGQKLCTLSLKCAPVAQGVMMWAREFTHGSEFSQSASFPTISPSVMSLARLIALRHPFTRNDALQVALAFLRHSNPDVSYQKLNSLKEQALRLIIVLLLAGDVALILSKLIAMLSKTGSSELDASLVRYFIGNLLDVLQPPYSPVFIQLFSKLLNAQRTIDAVKSAYLAKHSRQKLTSMLNVFRTIALHSSSPLGKDETTLILSLFAKYETE